VQEIEELKRQGLSIQAISPAAGIRSQDDPKVLAETRGNAGLRTATGAAEQAGCVQAVLSHSGNHF